MNSHGLFLYWDNNKSRRCVLSHCWAGLLALTLTGCGDQQTQSSEKRDNPKLSAPLVETVTAELADPRYTITAQGFLKPAERVAIVSEVSGTVEWVSEKLGSGELVKQGDPLFRIEQTTFAAQVARAEADLASAEAALSEAESSLKRLEYLAEIGAAAEANRDAARAAKEAADASRSRAKAQLTLAKDNFEATVVTAPFDAEVISESVTIGMFTTPGQAVAELFDITSGEIVVGLQFDDAQAVDRAMRSQDSGLTVTVFRDDPTALPQLNGVVVAMQPVIDPASRTVNFRIAVPKAFAESNSAGFLVNEYLSVNIPALAGEQQYKVARGVIRREQFVYMVDDSSVLRKILVQPTQRAEDHVQFSAQTALQGKRLLLTSLAEEQDGLTVSVQSNKQSSENTDSSN